MIAIATLEIATLNSEAMSYSTKTRRKKSNASSVQPRKLAATTCFCPLVQPESTLIVIVFLFCKACAFSLTERFCIDAIRKCLDSKIPAAAI